MIADRGVAGLFAASSEPSCVWDFEQGCLTKLPRFSSSSTARPPFLWTLRRLTPESP